MTEKKKYFVETPKAILTSSLTSLLSGVIFTLIFALFITFALNAIGTPERFYQVGKYLLLVLPSLITGMIIKKRNSPTVFLQCFLYSVLYFLLLTLISLFLPNAEYEMLSQLINFILIFSSCLLGALTSKNKKKKKLHKKKR